MGWEANSMVRKLTLICAVAVALLIPIQAFAKHGGGSGGRHVGLGWHGGPTWGGYWWGGAGGRLWDSSLLGIYPGWLGLELPVRAATGVNRMCSAETKRCKNDAFRRSHGLQFEMAWLARCSSNDTLPLNPIGHRRRRRKP